MFQKCQLGGTPHQDDFTEPARRLSISLCFRSASLEASPHHWEIMVVWSILLTFPLYLPPYTLNLLRGSLHHTLIVLEGPAWRPLLIIYQFRTSSEALNDLLFQKGQLGGCFSSYFHSESAWRLCTSCILLQKGQLGGRSSTKISWRSIILCFLEVPAWRLLLIIGGRQVLNLFSHNLQ